MQLHTTIDGLFFRNYSLQNDEIYEELFNSPSSSIIMSCCHVAMLPPCVLLYSRNPQLTQQEDDLEKDIFHHFLEMYLVSCFMSSTGSTSLLQFPSEKKIRTLKYTSYYSTILRIRKCLVNSNIEIYFEDNGQLIQQIYVVDSSRSVKYFAELICLLAA